MPSLPSHQALRTATADSHARLDHLFSGFDLGRADDYGRFLCAHAAAALALESALERADVASQLADWPERSRTRALLADLEALGLPVPVKLTAPSLLHAGAVWGAAYVLEGSRLGGAVLATRIAPDLPCAYLATKQAPGAWPRFLKQMDAALDSLPRIGAATSAALECFSLFEKAGSLQMESCRE